MARLFTKAALVLLGGLGVSVVAAHAQLAPTGAPAGINAALTRLFGEHTNFSARADVRVQGKNQTEKLSAVMQFGLRGDRIRAEFDLTEFQHKLLLANATSALPQAGLDRAITVFGADQPNVIIILPGLAAYVDMPLPRAEAATFAQSPPPQITRLGKEILDGRVCWKNRVIITDDDGQPHQATVWQAPDLKNFPVQIVTRANEDIVTLRFREIEFTPPSAETFEPPAGFARYVSTTALVQGVLRKTLGELFAPKAE